MVFLAGLGWHCQKQLFAQWGAEIEEVWLVFVCMSVGTIFAEHGTGFEKKKKMDRLVLVLLCVRFSEYESTGKHLLCLDHAYLNYGSFSQNWF